MPMGAIAFSNLALGMAAASVTLAELTRDWSRWTETEKVDFAQSFEGYQGRNRQKILRFLMQNGDHYVWSAIALAVATTFPPKESLPFLRNCSETCDVGQGSNYFQALWLTKSPEAVGIIRQCFDRVWHSPDLMFPAAFCNYTAWDAIWCIDALLRLGEPPESFRVQYEALKAHPTMGVTVEKRLSEHFDDRKG